MGQQFFFQFIQIFRNKANAARNAKFIMFGELNDTLKRIQETKSVIGTMVINHDGLAVRSSVDSTVTAQVMLIISI